MNRLPELITNVPPEQAALLRQDLRRLPAARRPLRLTVWNHGEAPAAKRSAPSTPNLEARPPVEVEARWRRERERQSYRIAADASAPVIHGAGPEGALYGFYRWLRAHGGCAWPWIAPENEGLADLPPLELPPGVVRPAVPWRGFEGALARWDLPFIERLMRWMLRNGWNLLLFNAEHWAARNDRAAILALARRHAVRLVLGAHAVNQFLPERLFETHPEYFGQRQGRRCLRTITGYPEMPGQVSRLPTQPCYGNPATRSFLARQIAAFIDANPGIDAFSLWPHDGANNWCECPQCACDTPYRWMHALAREILEQAQHPVPIEILAYANLLTPPERPLEDDPRIYTLFCPYLRRYRHRFYDPGLPDEDWRLGRHWPQPQPINPVDDREYGRLWDRWLPAWRDCRSGLGVFAYYQLAFVDHTGASDLSRYLYQRDLELVADEIRRFRQEGMGAFYDCSWPLPGLWPDARFASVLSALLWEPDRNASALERQYYLDTLGDRGEGVMAELHAILAALDTPGRPALPETVLETARGVFAAVPGLPGRRYRLWLDYVALADNAWQARKRQDPAALLETKQRIQRLLNDHRDLLEPHLYVDWMVRLSNGLDRVD